MDTRDGVLVFDAGGGQVCRCGRHQGIRHCVLPGDVSRAEEESAEESVVDEEELVETRPELAGHQVVKDGIDGRVQVDENP